MCRAGDSSRAMLLVALVAMLAGCTPTGTDHRAVFAVFGTEVELQLRRTGRDQAQAAFTKVGAILQDLHRELHPWEPGELMSLNRALAAGQAHETTPNIVALITASQSLEQATEGAFNPAIGALVNLWGFHTSRYPITDPPPTPHQLDHLLEPSPSTLELSVKGLEVRSANPAVRLDFSGIAKGLAVLRVCEVLAELEIGAAMVNAGGDVLVCSVGDRPWRVAIRGAEGGVLETLEIARPLAVFTSGNYYRFAEFDGERYAHILDPATGRPVDNLMQATVVDPDPMVADAGATALVVAGPARWRRLAGALEIEKGIAIGPNGSVSRLDKANASGR